MVTVVLTVGALLPIAVVYRDFRRSALATSAAALAVLTFGYQLDSVTQLLGADAAVTRWLLLAVDLLAIAIVWMLLWRVGPNIDNIVSALGIVAALFVALSLPKLVPSVTQHPEPPTAKAASVPSALGIEPDIYYIVVDGYARGDVLREVYGFDNGPFLDWLAGHGFYVADEALANYTRTHLSLASSLNMTYIDELAPNLTPDAADELNRLFDDPSAIKALIQLGYEYAHFDTIWWGTSDAPLADRRYGTGQSSEFEAVYLQTTLPGRFLPLPTWQEFQMQTLSHLPEVADNAASTVAFAHVLFPHPPFVFDERGNVLKRDAELGGSWVDQSGYIRQLRFVNHWLKSTIADILSRSDRQPIIILQSDHGSSSTAGARAGPALHRWERTAILSAYLVPQEMRENLYPTVTPVNSFRLLLRDVFGSPMPLLPDRSWFSPSDTDPRVDVTRELRDR